MSKRFLVIGAGRFGQSLIRKLFTEGQEVVACDRDEELLSTIDEYVNHSVVGDATDVHVLEEMNVLDFEAIFVSIGDNFESAIMTVKNLKDMGCKQVLCKANDRKRGEVLRAVGADQVVYPEEETGARIAKQLVRPGLIEFIEFSPNCSGIELVVPASFIGKNLVQLDFRRKYGLTILMVSKQNQEPIISPKPDIIFEDGDIFFVVGDNEDLEKLQRKIEREN